MATLTISTSDLQKMLNTENSDVVILKGRDDFAHYNAETIEAIEECERILKDPTVKGYNSIEELKEALEND